MEILLGCVAILVTLAFPVVAIIALVRTSSNQRRIERLERDLDAMRANLTAADQPTTEPATPQQPPPTPEPAPIEEPPSPESPPMEEPPPPLHEPEPPVVPPPDEEVFAPAAYEATTPPPPFTARPSPPPPPSSPALAERIRNFDWESLIGVKLFSWIAGIALALAAIFFLKYSFDRGLLQPPVRMAIGLITGVGLLILCELRVAQRYRVTANAMDAAGIAILYATLFSSYAIWGLVPGPLTFLLMIGVTAVAVALSIRRDSVFIALLGLIGGFATPAMLSSGEDHPITLFSYLLMLNAGLAWVAYRKRWPALAGLALVFTTIYQWGWVLKFLGDTNLPLALAIFLAFPLLSIGAFFFGSREGRTDGIFGRSAAVASIVPVTFAIYLAAVPAYGERHHLLFGFLLLVDLGLAWIAASRKAPETLHAIGAISTVLVVAIWIGVSWAPSMWPSVLGWIFALVLLYLLLPIVVAKAALRWPDSLHPFTSVGERAIWAAPLLLFVFPILAAIEPRTGSPALLLGVLFVLAAITSAVAIRLARPNLIHLAAAMIVITEAVWTANHLSPETLRAGLAWYAAFPLLFLAASLWGQRASMIDPSGERLPEPWIATSAYLFLLVVASQSALADPPWPLFTVLGLLLMAITFGSYRLVRPSLFAAAVVATQFVLLTWTGTLREGASPSTAVLATLATAGFAVGWRSVFLRSPLSSEKATGEIAAGALAGLFLAQLVVLVATQPANPPFLLVLVAHVALLVAILVIAAQQRWHTVAVVATIPASAAMVFYRAGYDPERWSSQMILACVLYAIFLAYPLVLGRRVTRETTPYLAPIFMSVSFFFFARTMLVDRGLAAVIGLLPLAQAALIGALLIQLLRIEPPEERTTGRLALVAGVVLAFVTLAIPLQLEREWITLGWALEGAALVWLFRRIPHRGLLYWAAGLLAVVFIRLAFNPAVLDYHPRTSTPILNWYLYAYTTAAIAMYAAAQLLPGGTDDLFRRLRSIWSSCGTILLFLLLNIEIADYFSDGTTITFDFSAGLAQDLTYTLGWAVFAIALLVAGLLLHNRPARMAAIGLLFASVLKGFLRDLMSLGGLYRIASLVGLAIALAFVAILLQRFVLSRREGAPV